VAPSRFRTVLALLALAAVGVLSGCGSSGGGSSAGVRAAVPPGSGEPSPAREGAALDARAINLRPGDVPGSVAAAVQEPGFVVRPGHEGPVREGPFDAWIERCDGGVAIASSRDAVGYSSLHFTRATSPARPGASVEGVRSVVFSFDSEAAARQELSVLGSARARTCLRRDGDALGGAGSETDLEVSAIPTARDAGVHGVRWSAIPASYRPPRRRYRDLLAFTSGRMLVVLHATGTPHPVGALLDARLLRLLHARAREHEG
jgi:hypothetical protein